MIGGRDEASDHNFFFKREFSVGENLPSVNADVAEAATHFFVAAGVENEVLAVAFPPEGRTVCDVAVVTREGFV